MGFNMAVNNKDQNLFSKIKKEFPCILLKCSRAYLYLVEWMRASNITDLEACWPAMYRENIDRFRKEVNAFEDFLANGNVEIDSSNADLYIPQRELAIKFRNYARDVIGAQPIPQWDDAMCRAAFSKHGLWVSNADGDKKPYPRNTQNLVPGPFVMGIDVDASGVQMLSGDGGAAPGFRTSVAACPPPLPSSPAPVRPVRGIRNILYDYQLYVLTDGALGSKRLNPRKIKDIDGYSQELENVVSDPGISASNKNTAREYLAEIRSLIADYVDDME